MIRLADAFQVLTAWVLETGMDEDALWTIGNVGDGTGQFHFELNAISASSTSWNERKRFMVTIEEVKQ